MKQSNLLEQLYQDIQDIIVSRQNPVTGLLPASTSVNIHGDYTDAWVRDNVYSILAVWALSMAFKRHGDRYRQDQLEQTTIKLMRGLLQSMMRQAPKVEKFKHTQDRLDSLHAKYDTHTGLEVVADDAWGHLQIDATSIFLLMLAQMSASGLRIITTLSEVDFVQNLVYYIAAAYRIPDYGIWERGNKINNGKTEVNCSSVGMAKAALQALDNFNLFGPNATRQAIIHTVPDAVALARSTLTALLPRESLTKEVDSALLSVIGYPAFAVGNPTLVEKTRTKILSKLQGKYGCKRFLWDGHQTEVEDISRIHYEVSELANFENIESEWPLFFTYLYLNALFADDQEMAKEYRQKIESVMVDKEGKKLIPELYYVAEEHLDDEKNEPQSQPRIANENLPLVWAQSLYYTGLMLDEGLLTLSDLDPLKMRKRSSRYGESEVALVVLAETAAVKQCLAGHGVISETIEEIKPLSVVSAKHLVEAYTQVGANEALGLTGRPRRRLRSLASSQTYDINNSQFLCLSWLQSEYGDYRRYDADLVVEKILREIQQIRQDWFHPEVATFTLLVDEETCNSPQFEKLFTTLRSIQLRETYEEVGYASASLALRASRLNRFEIPGLCLAPIKARQHADTEELLEVSKQVVQEAAVLIEEVMSGSDEGIICKALTSFFTKIEDDAVLSVDTDQALLPRTLLRSIYKYAQRHQLWMVSRLCFALLGHAHFGLVDSLTALGSRHLSVLMDSANDDYINDQSFYSDFAVVDAIEENAESPLEKTLIQELLVSLGSLLRSEAPLFEGLRTIQLHNLIRVCSGQKADDAGELTAAVDKLARVSPHQLYTRIISVLSSQHDLFVRGVQHSLLDDLSSDMDVYGEGSRGHFAVAMDWFEWRAARGLITGFDDEFLNAIWNSLGQANTLIFGAEKTDKACLDCESARRTMTAGEESFAKLIDQRLQPIHPAYYKSTVIEALYAYTEFARENPDIKFVEPVNLGDVAERAADQFVADQDNVESQDRHLDVLMQQSPSMMHRYLKQALAMQAAAQPEESEDPIMTVVKENTGTDDIL